MALKVALIICCALEFLFVPWFLKVMWPNPSKKSLLLKMICASLFVAVGVLSIYVADNFSVFAMMMLVGLIFGWIGDFFLHVNTTFICFCIGFANFLIGHIVYIAAYIKTLGIMFPEYNQINIIEIAALILLSFVAVLVFVKLKLKMPAKWMYFFIGLYFLILAIMFIKATALGYNYMCSGVPFGWCALTVLCLGSLNFFVSDVLIGVIMFGDRKKNYPLKIVNIVTYFVAQVLLATSILFVKG